jgi:hypothetical protein
MRYVYREKKSGRFASKKKWERSHGSGGKYKREKVKPKPEPAPEPARPEFVEYTKRIAYGSKKKSNQVNVEIHLLGPEGASADEVDRVFAEWAFTKDLERGWAITSIAWDHGKIAARKFAKTESEIEEANDLFVGLFLA